MKNSNQCPKCGGADILRLSGWDALRGFGNDISVGLIDLNPVGIARFVCADCGFSEEWIESQEDIEKLRARHQAPPIDDEIAWQNPIGAVSGSPPLLICEVCDNRLEIEEETYFCPRCDPQV